MNRQFNTTSGYAIITDQDLARLLHHNVSATAYALFFHIAADMGLVRNRHYYPEILGATIQEVDQALSELRRARVLCVYSGVQMRRVNPILKITRDYECPHEDIAKFFADFAKAWSEMQEQPDALEQARLKHKCIDLLRGRLLRADRVVSEYSSINYVD